MIFLKKRRRKGKKKKEKAGKKRKERTGRRKGEEKKDSSSLFRSTLLPRFGYDDDLQNRKGAYQIDLLFYFLPCLFFPPLSFSFTCFLALFFKGGWKASRPLLLPVMDFLSRGRQEAGFVSSFYSFFLTSFTFAYLF